MSPQEIYVELVGELLDGVDHGDFTGASDIPAKYTYGHLNALLQLADQLQNGRELYEKLYDRIVGFGKRKIREKVSCGQKVRVAFLAISAAEWAADSVYRMLSEDERLECFWVMCPLVDREREARRKIEEQSYKFFYNNHYDVRRIYQSEEDICAGWEQIGGLPDIVVHLTSWYQSLPEPFRIDCFPLNIINCYVPYGMYVADSLSGMYAKMAVYNKEIVNLMWRVYADSEANLSGYMSYGLLHGKNVRYSGFPKMDYFFGEREYTEEQIRKIWKIPSAIGVNEMKKIIIAPHHTIDPSELVVFSTFARNAYFWLYLAKKYQDRICFIFKPHPNLRMKAVRCKYFKSYEEYEAYIEAWQALPNARVSEEEGYLDIFATSDGMIMDSASFLGEYLYVNKPLLFLTREEQAFNVLGKKAVSGYYTAKGEDYIAIEQFVERVILQGGDTMKDRRHRIFAEELDYAGKNGCSASEFIYKDLTNLLEE